MHAYGPLTITADDSHGPLVNSAIGNVGPLRSNHRHCYMYTASFYSQIKLLLGWLQYMHGDLHQAQCQRTTIGIGDFRMVQLNTME